MPRPIETFKLGRTYNLDIHAIKILKEMSHLKSRPMGDILEGLIIEAAHRAYGKRKNVRFRDMHNLLRRASQIRLDL